MADLELTDKLSDFPTQYNADILGIQDELHFKTDGADSIKYTGTATISGDLDVTGSVTGTWGSTIDASSVIMSGGLSVQEELQTVSVVNNVILDQGRDFERRATEVRKSTVSGFSKVGDYTLQQSLSSLPGLGVFYQGAYNSTASINKLVMGYNPDNERQNLIVVNGYNIVVNSDETQRTDINLPTPPTTGTRQDLVFIEVWKEEVNKDTGLLFPYGNTQYAGVSDVDGTPLSETQAEYTGSAYFTTDDGVLALRANEATEEFLGNPNHNVGVLTNGNLFQIRYRIRVEAGFSNFWYAREGEYSILSDEGGEITGCYRPQGQLASAPSRGEKEGAEGIIKIQTKNTAFSGTATTIDDEGILLGGAFNGAWSNNLQPISGLSLDGFTYAIPVCVVQRRNTGIYSRGNKNGTAFANAWIVSGDTDLASGYFNHHNTNGQTLVTVGSTTFKIVEWDVTSGLFKWRLVRVSGSGTPDGSATWSYSGVTRTSSLSIVKVDDGSFLNNGGTGRGVTARLDGLYPDIVDRRDVLDLRHKVGKIDIEAEYQNTFKEVVDGTFRQEWEELTAYDPDGNGLGTTESGIYGNVITESLGLGQTVPDAHINTDITKVVNTNNDTPVGFNNSRTLFSNASEDEVYTAVLADQSDPEVLEGENDFITYNAVSHEIAFDLTQHDSYINDLTKDPTFASGSNLDLTWGNGAKVAGVLTKTDDYTWDYEIKGYGTIVVVFTGSVSMWRGDVYQDSFGNNWVVKSDGTTSTHYFIPEYTSQTGSVLPLNSTVMTFVSGIGDPSGTISGTAPRYVTLTLDPSLIGNPEISFGYDLSAHGTVATESITIKFPINYKEGSSCLPELPFNDEIIQGATLFLDGDSVKLPEHVYVTGRTDKDKKKIELKGFKGRKPVIDLGDFGTGYNNTGIYSPSVIHDGTKYVMYYSGYSAPNARIFRATSVNGIDFEDHQMVLDVGTTGQFDEIEVVRSCVTFDGVTWKMWYGAYGGLWSIGYATSTDGITWTKQGQVMANTFGGGSSTIPTAVIMESVSDYKMFYSSNDGHWVTRLATSTDGVTWTDQGECVPYSGLPEDWNYYHVTFHSVIKDGSIYKALVSGRDGQISSESGTGVNHKYMISTDAQNWHIVSDAWGGTVGDFDSVYIGGPSNLASLIKVDKRYEVFYTGYEGSNWRIGRMVLAMSDQNNTGTSATGVYVNTTPQISLGFGSLDSVVLDYERKAKQPQLITETVDIIPKNILAFDNISNLNRLPIHEGNIANDLTSLNTGFSQTMLEDDGYVYRDGWYYLSDSMISKLFPAILKNITPSIETHVAFKDDYTVAYPSINAEYPELSELWLVNGVTGGGSKITTSIVRSGGKVMFCVNPEPSYAATRLISYLLGNAPSFFDMIGRPLVK